jgi:hypothetical protein
MESINNYCVCQKNRRQNVGATGKAGHEGVNTQEIRSSLVWRCSQQSRSFCRDVQRPPRLVPLFPVGIYTPQSVCAHHGPIQRGSLFCCMICHKSGHDDHPAVQDISSPSLSINQKRCECLPNTPSSGKPNLETRKQRRQRMYGESSPFNEKRRTSRPYRNETARETKSSYAQDNSVIQSPGRCVKMS